MNRWQTIAVVAVWTAAAAQGQDPRQLMQVRDDRPILTRETYPRVDGSTSAQPLGVLAACRMTHTSFAWQTRWHDGSRLLLPTAQAYDPAVRLDLSFPEPPQRALPMAETKWEPVLAPRVAHRGTHESYVGLIGGESELILVAREPSDDEVALAREKGVRLERKPVALDAFVFIVNRENPVKGLTVDQIRDIYTGKAANWSQVGGPDLGIHAYRRNRNSGSEETMQMVVMKGLEMVEGQDLAIPISMVGPFNALIRDRRGLGYTFRYYDTYMVHMPQVRAIAVNGVEPTPETIANRTYPFVTPVWMVWRADLAADSPAATVRDWLLSPAGQAVVAESGYVPVGRPTD